MANVAMDHFSPTTENPLDVVEQVVTLRELACERPAQDELVAEIEGSWCSYRLWFSWQPDLQGMMLISAFDLKIPKAARTQVQELLCLINERIWLGHFDMSSEDGGISFRHGVLMKGMGAVSESQMSELVDIAFEECERFYPAFQSVIWGGQKPEDAMKFAMFETFGEA